MACRACWLQCNEHEPSMRSIKTIATPSSLPPSLPASRGREGNKNTLMKSVGVGRGTLPACHELTGEGTPPHLLTSPTRMSMTAQRAHNTIHVTVGCLKGGPAKKGQSMGVAGKRIGDTESNKDTGRAIHPSIHASIHPSIRLESRPESVCL
mmetsp:Transcript_34328/g.85050  ORF Transcript_34328/g.85050 Transcript_34328/m.85050 type:complete len:152 (+) Transcript_34328:164-619(+)